MHVVQQVTMHTDHNTPPWGYSVQACQATQLSTDSLLLTSNGVLLWQELSKVCLNLLPAPTPKRTPKKRHDNLSLRMCIVILRYGPLQNTKATFWTV